MYLTENQISGTYPVTRSTTNIAQKRKKEEEKFKSDPPLPLGVSNI